MVSALNLFSRRSNKLSTLDTGPQTLSNHSINFELYNLNVSD